MVEAAVQILVMLLVAFLLGFVISWLWRQQGWIKLNREMTAKRKHLAEANQTVEELKDQNQSLQAKLDLGSNPDLVSSTDHHALRAELAKTKQMNLSLNNQNTELENQNSTLLGQLKDKGKGQASSDEVQQLRAALSRLESRNKMLEGSIKDLEERNQWLMDHRSEELPKESDDPDLEKFTNAFSSAPLESTEPSFSETIGVKSATADQSDDLKKISGVGPFIEKKLNAIGIYTYEQIADLNTEQIKKITEAIEFFPGRMERDDWKGQARELLSASNGG